MNKNIKKLVFILFSLLFFCVCFGFYYIYTVRENSYSAMMKLVEKGDLESALKSCRSPLMRGMGKRKLDILEATYNMDVDKTLSAIKNDCCYGKCFHVVDDWTEMVLPYYNSQTNESNKLDVLTYVKEVEALLKEETGLEIDLIPEV